MEEERRAAAETFLRQKNKESKGIYGSGSGQSGLASKIGKVRGVASTGSLFFAPEFLPSARCTAELLERAVARKR